MDDPDGVGALDTRNHATAPETPTLRRGGQGGGDVAVWTEGSTRSDWRDDETAGNLTAHDAKAARHLVSGDPVPIHSDASRGKSSAKTPSPDAEGRVRLRDPGLGVGDEGDPMFTLAATGAHAVLEAEAFQQHGSDVGRMGTLRAGHGDVQSGVPFVADEVGAIQPGAKGWRGMRGDGSDPMVMDGPQSLTAKGNGEAWLSDHVGALQSAGGGQPGQGYAAVLEGDQPVNSVTGQMRYGADDNRAQGGHLVSPEPAQAGWLADPDTTGTIAAKWSHAGGPSGDEHYNLATQRDESQDDLEDPLLPLGLDSARYKALGNAVCVPVAEWLGRRLAWVIAGQPEEPFQVDRVAEIPEGIVWGYARPYGWAPESAAAMAAKPVGPMIADDQDDEGETVDLDLLHPES